MTATTPAPAMDKAAITDREREMVRGQATGLAVGKMLTLNEVKLFLRLDGDEEDNLVSSLILMSTELVEGILRRKLTEFDPVPETIKQAILLAVATFYENRQGGKDGLNSADLIDLIKRLTFAHRKESF
jgi:uncharacterized phage protein (predicted DNA packaging)